MRTAEDIIQALDYFNPAKGNWLPLDDLVTALLDCPTPEKGIIPLFKVLERFPEEDGGGVLWSVVHGLEHMGGYEQELLNSLNRQPSLMGLIMLRRIENTGQSEIAELKISAIYTGLLHHAKVSKSMQENISELIRQA